MKNFSCTFVLTAPGNENVMEHAALDAATTAHSLNCKSLIIITGNFVAGESYEITRRRVVRNLTTMAQAGDITEEEEAALAQALMPLT